MLIKASTSCNLTKEDFGKLGAKRISDELGELRAILREIERAASDVVLNICPFDFKKFYVQFTMPTLISRSERRQYVK